MDWDKTISGLLNLAGHHKDRLHTLQATEWNVYYGVWLVLLASFYFILAGSHTFMIDTAEGLSLLSHIPATIRALRCALCTSASTAFYFIILKFYFSKFYPKNYRSIIESRTSFYYYSSIAAELLGTEFYTGENEPIHPRDNLGYRIELLAENYKCSKIRGARKFIMIYAVIWAVVLVCLISYIGPVKETTMNINGDASVELHQLGKP